MSFRFSHSFGPGACRTTTNMASSADVHVRICGQEIIKYDLEIKALIQVRVENRRWSSLRASVTH